MSFGSWIETQALRLRIEAHATWLAVRDDRTPLLAKMIGFAVAGYALSPIDLIPDFVPILGLLDDLVLLPLGLWIFLKLVPPAIFDEHLATARAASTRPISRGGMVAILLVWVALVGLVALYLFSWRYW